MNQPWSDWRADAERLTGSWAGCCDATAAHSHTWLTATVATTSSEVQWHDSSKTAAGLFLLGSDSHVSTSSSGPLSFLSWSAHLHEAALVEPEQPPAFLLREVLGAATLVELDGRLVVLRHHEHHAGAARLRPQLEEGREFTSNSTLV